MSKVNLKRLLLSAVMVVGLLFAITPLANAETEVIQGQIVSTNTTWGASSKALKIEGLIQIRAGVTLTINPGSSLDVSKGSFLVLGSLSIIGTSTSQASAVFAPSWLSGSGSVSVSGLNITGDGGSLLPYEATGAISIINSSISGFNSISEQTQSRSLVFSDNTVFKVSSFHPNPIFHTSYSVTITNNSFFEIQKIGGESSGIYVNLGQVLPTYNLTGNYFENISTMLTLQPRNKDSYPNLTLSNNNFATPTKVTIVANGFDFSQNYWKGITTENQLRSQAIVLDGITNITLPIMKLAPLLTSPPITQPSYTRLKALLDAEISAKAAADTAAADKVAADKVAAELKAKQEAEAKAQLEAERVAAELKAKEAAAAKAAADKAAALKKTTITCVKGKLTKKVTAVKPVCPAGYKKK